MTGGCGFCTGFGQVIIGGKSTNAPWYSGVSLVQICFIASTCSPIFLNRVGYAVP
jgi:hypothetical protein